LFPAPLPGKERAAAEAIEDRGFEGCIRSRPHGKPQVLLMNRETLDRLGLPWGTVKENLTVTGLDFQRLGMGRRLKIGESLPADCRAVRSASENG
jgi:hypothetical protein